MKFKEKNQALLPDLDLTQNLKLLYRKYNCYNQYVTDTNARIMSHTKNTWVRHRDMETHNQIMGECKNS